MKPIWEILNENEFDSLKNWGKCKRALNIGRERLKVINKILLMKVINHIKIN